MKNSAWYRKMWLKKLNQLPVKGDVNTSWANMKEILDLQLPVNPGQQTLGNQGHQLPGNSIAGSSQAVKTLGAKIVSILGYVLPAAAMIGAVTYVSLPPAIKEKNVAHKQEQHYKSPGERNPVSALSKDTVVLLNSNQVNEVVANSHLSPVESSVFSKENIVRNHQTNTVNTSNRIAPGTIAGSVLNLAILPEALKSNPLADQLKEVKSSAIEFLKINPAEESFSGGTSGKGKPDKLRLPDTKKLKDKTVTNKQTKEKSIRDKIVRNKAVKDKLNRDKSTRTKSVSDKPARNRTVREKQELSSPLFNYNLEAGMNLGSQSQRSFYAGIGLSYAITDRLLLNTGLAINTARLVSGEYTHPAYFRPDSSAAFKVLDSRKIVTADIPLTLEYRILNAISIKLGPVISIPVKQTEINTKIAPIINPQDTIYHTKEIKKAISNSSVSKINLGVTGGISIRIKQFSIEGKYQALKPYQVSTDLGSYSKSYQSFNIGVGYRFKK